jgi:multidrug resistance efflux pump
MNELIDMNKNSNTNTKPQKQMKQFEAVNKALGLAELASTDEGAYLNEEQLSTLDALLAENAQNDAALQTAQDDLKQVQDDLKAANTIIQSQKTEIEDLRKNPGAESAKIISGKETASGAETKDDNVVNEKKSFVENMDAVADEFGVK